MEKKDIRVDFDKEEDIISIFGEGKKSKFSFDLELPNGDIVVDYGFNGEVVGLEIFGASNYFPDLNKVKENSKLKGKLSVQYGPNWAQISFEISGPGIKPVSNSLISPYNRKMILEH